MKAPGTTRAQTVIARQLSTVPSRHDIHSFNAALAGLLISKLCRAGSTGLRLADATAGAVLPAILL